MPLEFDKEWFESMVMFIYFRLEDSSEIEMKMFLFRNIILCFNSDLLIALVDVFYVINGLENLDLKD